MVSYSAIQPSSFFLTGNVEPEKHTWHWIKALRLVGSDSEVGLIERLMEQ
jgi:hypothetical protein